MYKDSLNLLERARLQKLLDSTKDTKITWWGTTYQKSKESELLLGLDLQGGINVTLDIELEGLIKGLANNPRDASLVKAIQLADQKKLTNGGANLSTYLPRLLEKSIPGSNSLRSLPIPTETN